MTKLGLIVRNLRYFRGVNLALIAGMIVATAALSGALMVGDSVRQSLAQLARDRLGKVDDALIARRFFAASLAGRLQSDPALASGYEVVPAIILSGGASNENETIRAGSMQVLAAGGDWVPVPRGQCLPGGPTAAALGGAKTGDMLLLSLPDKPDQPREAALSRRSREDTLAALRARVWKVDRAQDMPALFNPQGGQRVPQNVWVNLADLQDATELPGRVNALLVHAQAGGDTPQSAEPLNQQLRQIVRLEDYGLSLAPAGSQNKVALTSAAIYLDPPLVSAAEAVTRSANIPLQKVTVNLINSVRLDVAQPSGAQTPVAQPPSAVISVAQPPSAVFSVAQPPSAVFDRRSKSTGGFPPDGGTQPRAAVPQATVREIHYAVAAGISPLDSTDLGDDEIAINQWTADQLGAKVGDRLHLTYYERQPTGDLAEVSSDAKGFRQGLRIVKVLPMSGLGADRTLTPQYKGLTDADAIADWDPPEGVRIDKKLVTKADEDYWHNYRAAPKLFLSFGTAERLWGGSLGNVTGLRVPTDQADELRRLLHETLDPAAMGLSFQPILAQQLAASSGNTDFGEYFLYFSFFLIAAAVLLVAMLLRLSIEQRARQIGLLAAAGFKPWGLRGLVLGEGMALAAIGALLGSPAAIGYTWLMIYGLRTWWNGAVGTTALYLHVSVLTLAYGLVASLFVAFFAILWAVWRVGRTPAATLLAGGWGAEVRTRRTGRLLRVVGSVLMVLALAIFTYALSDRTSAQTSFMGGGGILLFGWLFWLAGVLRPGLRRPTGAEGVATLQRLGVRNATRHTARSVLAAGLIAFAAFTLITVAAFRQGAPSDTGTPSSGAGGFRLILQAGIPLLGDLNTEQGRHLLGIHDSNGPLWHDVHFVSMRRWQGQDVSCLNLTQPTTPTILAAPPELMRSLDDKGTHRFTFVRTSANQPNPWELLNEAQPGDEVPVIADDNTATYVLHLGIGQTIALQDAAGRPRRLKLVATLNNSIFQSELLMGERNFRELFPEVDGFGVVLLDCPPSKQDQVRAALNTELGEYAASVEPTASRLAQYLTIQNSYLSTFQALGALGLMLGTIGLAVVLVRTVIERRSELALLASLGFRRADRVWLVLSENVFLLVLGLAVGCLCAVLGIIPAIRQSAQAINGWALAATLLIVLLLGVACSALAVWLSGAHISPADLRRE